MNIWVDSCSIVARMGELGIATTGWTSGSPSKLDSLILEKQREFERKTKRKFEKQTETILIDGNGKDTIVLPNFPVNSITSIISLGCVIGDDSDITSYRIDNSTGRVQAIGGGSNAYVYFPEGFMNIQVIYDYGYEVIPNNNIPDDIKDAVIFMVLLDVISRTPADWEKTGLANMKIADYSEGYAGGEYYGGIYGAQKREWTKKVEEIIQNYKRILIG